MLQIELLFATQQVIALLWIKEFLSFIWNDGYQVQIQFLIIPSSISYYLGGSYDKSRRNKNEVA